MQIDSNFQYYNRITIKYIQCIFTILPSTDPTIIPNPKHLLITILAHSTKINKTNIIKICHPYNVVVSIVLSYHI